MIKGVDLIFSYVPITSIKSQNIFITIESAEDNIISLFDISNSFQIIFNSTKRKEFILV